MMRNMKKWRAGLISALLVLAVTVSTLCFSGVFAGAEEYDEKNPEFAEARINSDVELSYGITNAYVQTTTFTQDAAAGRYEIETDAYVAWHNYDDVAMLYRQYNIGDTSSDKLTIELTVNSQEPTVSGQGLHTTASSGIMVRGSVDDPSSPMLYLHTRATGVDVVYRAEYAAGSLHAPSGFLPVYPVVLRIEKVGNKYTCSFKNANMPAFRTIAALGCKISGPLYAGPTSHCSDPEIPIHSVFSNYSAVGSGTVNVTSTPGGTSSTGPAPLDAEDPPFDPDTTLLYETFTDGSMTEGKEAVNNPIWTSPEGSIVTNEENTDRSWYKSFADTTEYIGSQYWTDYSVSMNYEIAGGLDPQSNDQLILWTRYKDIDPYGYYGVGFAIETVVTVSNNEQVITPTLVVYHRQRAPRTNMGTKVASAAIDPMIGTGEHTLRVDCLDNTFTAYIDGKQILTWADESTSPNLRGGIGIGTTETEVCLDDIIVTKLEDPYGGDYDNYTGANYNDEIPSYVQDFMDKYEVDY